MTVKDLFITKARESLPPSEGHFSGIYLVRVYASIMDPAILGINCTYAEVTFQRQLVQISEAQVMYFWKFIRLDYNDLRLGKILKQEIAE